jgi:hypothetical protein
MTSLSVRNHRKHQSQQWFPRLRWLALRQSLLCHNLRRDIFSVYTIPVFSGHATTYWMRFEPVSSAHAQSKIVIMGLFIDSWVLLTALVMEHRMLGFLQTKNYTKCRRKRPLPILMYQILRSLENLRKTTASFPWMWLFWLWYSRLRNHAIF